MSYCTECGREFSVDRYGLHVPLCAFCIKYPGTDTPCMFCSKTFDEHRLDGPVAKTPCGLFKRGFQPSKATTKPEKRKPSDRLRRFGVRDGLREEELFDILDEFDARLSAIEERIEKTQKRIGELDHRTVGSIKIGGR